MKSIRIIPLALAAAAFGPACDTARNVEESSQISLNCTSCHGTPTAGWTETPASLHLAAPPNGLHGETATSQPPVGAHQKHLGNGSAFSAGVACTECHPKPTELVHSNGVLELTFGPLATQGGLAPSYAGRGGTCSNTYCHGTALAGAAAPTPSWTGSVSCGDCHGLPPNTGRHQVISHSGFTCYVCHGTVGTNTTAPGIQSAPAARALHPNGVKDVSIGGGATWDPVQKTCTNVGCHSTPSSVRPWYF